MAPPVTHSNHNDMTADQFEKLQRTITEQIASSVAAAVEPAIEKVVNGKIKALDKKIDDYINVDTLWKEKDSIWKQTAQPAVDLGNNTIGFGTVLKWLAATGLAVVAFIKLFIK